MRRGVELGRREQQVRGTYDLGGRGEPGRQDANDNNSNNNNSPDPLVQGVLHPQHPRSQLLSLAYELAHKRL